MRRILKGMFVGLFLIVALGDSALAQKALTWPEVRDKFEAANPSLRAGQIGIDESRAQVTTQWPGRAGEEVEQQITIPIEIQMNGIPHLQHVAACLRI